MSASHDSALGGTGEDYDPSDDHHYTSLGLNSIKVGFWCFLGSETFFFGSLIGTYMSYHGKSLVGPFPRDVFNVHVTSISTFLLLMSSVTMVLAVREAKMGKRTSTIGWMVFTALLGATFVSFQVYEFSHFFADGMSLQGNLFGSTFFVMTGFHGTHVFVGVIWLLSQCLFLNRGWIKGDVGTMVEVTGLYWHFVDIVWIVIFTLVYLMEYT
jgi:heme/copper-type cytochrome/quinol oxidase subunit 3